MKLFLVGDFVSNSGPAIANKMLRKGLANRQVLYSDAKNKLTRILEIFVKTLMADCVCFCSYSKANYTGIRIARLLNKKVFYIMHGYRTFENKINKENISGDELRKINESEKYLFKNVDKVFCVSAKFMEFMKQTEPDYAHKFDYNNNGIDIARIEQNASLYSTHKKSNQIISIGGGMRQKNNLTICKAIDKLNQEKGLDLNYIVIGLPYTDKKEICSYEFVTYYEKLPYEQVLRILADSYLYIQNSCFETFGLAVIEALISNCNLLISNNIGAIGVIDTIESGDLIYDTADVDEIAGKIERIMHSGNVKRLQDGLDRGTLDYNQAGENLINKIIDTLK